MYKSMPFYIFMHFYQFYMHSRAIIFMHLVYLFIPKQIGEPHADSPTYIIILSVF